MLWRQIQSPPYDLVVGSLHEHCFDLNHVTKDCNLLPGSVMIDTMLIGA